MQPRMVERIIRICAWFLPAVVLVHGGIWQAPEPAQGSTWLRLSDKEGDGNAAPSFLAEMSWCIHTLGLAEGLGLVFLCLLKRVFLALLVRGQAQNSLRLLRPWEQQRTWTNESLNKNSSKFVSRPVIAKQFEAPERAQFLGFSPAPYLCQTLETTEISPAWADKKETELSVICILMIWSPNCLLKKPKINLNLWDMTSGSNPKPGAVTQTVSLELLQRKWQDRIKAFPPILLGPEDLMVSVYD